MAVLAANGTRCDLRRDCRVSRARVRGLADAAAAFAWGLACASASCLRAAGADFSPAAAADLFQQIEARRVPF